MEGVAFQLCRIQDLILVRHIHLLLMLDHVLASFLKHSRLDFVFQVGNVTQTALLFLSKTVLLVIEVNVWFVRAVFSYNLLANRTPN